MNASAPLLQASDVDSRRFRQRVYRAVLREIDERRLLKEIISEGIDIAIVRAPAGSSSKLDRLRRYGMAPIHADTLVYYQVPLAQYEPRPLRNGDLVFSLAGDGDQAELAALVSTTFRDYTSHYHANPELDPADILAGYAEWALAYCANEGAGRTTWVARREGKIVAFACCSEDPGTSACEGVLFGVHPDHAGGGLYGDLIRYSQAHYRGIGYATMNVSTQIWNAAVQKVWSREGFVFSRAYDTFHVNAMLSAGELLVDREVTFTADQVARFAEATGDTNPIHLDDESARQAGFDGRIAHGLLAGGELSRIFGTEVPGSGTLYLRSELVFLRPILCGHAHRLQVRYRSPLPLAGRIPAVATIRDARGELCLLGYSDLLKRD